MKTKLLVLAMALSFASAQAADRIAFIPKLVASASSPAAATVRKRRGKILAWT